MNEFYIPIVLFITLGFVGSLFFYLAFRSKQEVHKTIQLAIEKGDGLLPDTIENMLGDKRNPMEDFKRGVLLVSLSIAFAIYGFIAQDGNLDIVGIACFPLAIGIGYLVVWKYANKTN